MKPKHSGLGAFSELFIRHGEKLVVAVVGLAALWLLWGGVNSLRSLSVKDTQTPEAIDRAATQARGHIDRDAEPPPDLLPPREPLARGIDPWRMPLVPWWTGSAAPWLSIAKPPVLAVLDRPIFEELPKRGQPEVFPVEDLKAVAGIAIIPEKPKEDPAKLARNVPVQQAPAENWWQTVCSKCNFKDTPVRRPQKPEDPNFACVACGGRLSVQVAPPPEGWAKRQEPAAEPAKEERGRIVPYVVVTGLIPVKKQREEHLKRFEGAARPAERDRNLDVPKWCDYEIDRAVVGPDGKEAWTRIDLAVARKRAAEWAAAAGADVDPDFQLTAEENARSKSTPIDFCASLPRRLDGTWELANLHPWVVDRLVAKLDEARKKADSAVGQPDEADAGLEDTAPEEMDQRQQALQAAQQQPELPEYRLFRFVDTAVVPGQTYRYRARLKIRNPNHDLVPDNMRPFLEDPALAIEPKLASPDSKASTSAVVPDITRILVGTLRRAEIKEMRLKPGMLEVLVLAPSENSGSFTLRSLVADLGAVMDVDEDINKRYRGRARGEKVVTRRLLLDARGRQEDRREGPAEKEKPPGAIPEPLDVICLRPDGSFEVASLADSEQSIKAYGATLKDPLSSGPIRPPDVLPDQPGRPRVSF